MNPTALCSPGRQVLLASDHPADRRRIEACVGAAGATLGCVGDGEQAVQQALAGEFDLVLLSIDLPVIDGRAAATLLRAAGYRAPVVALAPSDRQADSPGWRDSGFDEVLARPIDRHLLRALLARTLPTLPVQAVERQLRLEAIVQRLAAEFRADLPQTLQTLQTALQGRQWETLRQVSHRIKGIAGSLGFPHLSQLAEPVELSLDHGDTAAAMRAAEHLLAALNEADTRPVAEA